MIPTPKINIYDGTTGDNIYQGGYNATNQDTFLRGNMLLIGNNTANMQYTTNAVSFNQFLNQSYLAKPYNLMFVAAANLAYVNRSNNWMGTNPDGAFSVWNSRTI